MSPILLLLALSAAAPPQLRMCSANTLAFSADSLDGYFDGMSQSGTLLILRNIGPDPCRVPPFPRITFRDRAGKALPIQGSVRGAAGLHPGPVVLPAILAPQAELTAELHWVSGKVFDPGVCLTPAQVSVQIEGTDLSVPLAADLCGPSAKEIGFSRTRLRLDPVYKP